MFSGATDRHNLCNLISNVYCVSLRSVEREFTTEILLPESQNCLDSRMIAARMTWSEGDGGLSKLNVGGRPKSKGAQGDGGGTYWDPTGILIARPQRPKR